MKITDVRPGDKIVTARYASGAVKAYTKVKLVTPCTRRGKYHVNAVEPTDSRVGHGECFDHCVNLDVIRSEPTEGFKYSEHIKATDVVRTL